MTLSIRTLRSGSSGNAILARARDTVLLVDVGLTRDTLTDELARAGLAPSCLSGIVVTHGHADHLGAAKSFCRVHRISLYMSAEAVASDPAIRKVKTLRAFETGKTIAIGAIAMRAVALPHDAPGTVACVLSHGGASFGIATDLGRSHAALEAELASCDAFLLEFNHDERLLRQGPYPWRLKRRVFGEEGHLSNDQAAAILARSVGPRTRHVFLGHLSEKNNRADLALASAARVLERLGRTDVRIEIAPRGHASAELLLANP